MISRAKKLGLSVLVFAVSVVILSSCSFADSFSRAASMTNVADWLVTSGTSVDVVDGMLTIGTPQSPDIVKTGAKLFFRTQRAAETAAIAAAGSPDVRMTFTNKWLYGGTASEFQSYGQLYMSMQTQVTRDYGFEPGTWTKIGTAGNANGDFGAAMISTMPTTEMRYAIAATPAAPDWSSLSGVVTRGETGTQTIEYKGLLSDGEKIWISIANWDNKDYVPDTNASGIKSWWIGDPKYTIAAPGTMSPAFGATWEVNPLSAATALDPTYTIDLKVATSQARRYIFKWDPYNTYKKGTVSMVRDGGIAFSTMTNFTTVKSADFGKNITYVDKVGNDAKMTTLIAGDGVIPSGGVKGLQFDIPYAAGTPVSGDTTGTIYMMGVSITFPISWNDLSYVKDGNLIPGKIEDEARNSSFPLAVLKYLRPVKYFGGNANDLYSMVQQKGLNPTDFFKVTNLTSTNGEFKAEINLKALVVDGYGPRVDVREGFFIFYDSKEDQQIIDPIVISTGASGGGGSVGGGGGSGGGCDAGAGAVTMIAAAGALAAIKRRK